MQVISSATSTVVKCLLHTTKYAMDQAWLKDNQGPEIHGYREVVAITDYPACPISQAYYSFDPFSIFVQFKNFSVVVDVAYTNFACKIISIAYLHTSKINRLGI